MNKRTARLSANISLIKNNLVPLAFNDVMVEDYISAMIAVYELQDVRPLVDLYVYSYLRTCAAYDSTVKTIGFDEVRVRYRQERRKVVRDVIVQTVNKQELKNFIDTQAKELVPAAVWINFVEDVLEDLELIDESRLVGLDITPQQLKEWKTFLATDSLYPS